MLKAVNVNFSYLESKTLKSINFQLDKGSVLALIGESGCGKSTLLKIIHGLLDCDTGSISWNEIRVEGPKMHLVPGMSFSKYLAQDFDLMPFTTVAENIGSYLSNFFIEEKKNRIKELLEVVEMNEFANTKVKYLSGGQMQRVALAKVFAKEPELVLLDEPFSHIDNFRKNTLRRKIFKYINEKNITCIVATHDVDDVLSFTNETLVLKNGELLLKGNTKAIYNNPPSFYVASLFGDVNEMKWENNSLLVYPHQLEISSDSNFEVEVVDSYFKGKNYLIESVFKNQIIFFESKYAIEAKQKIGLKKIDL